MPGAKRRDYDVYATLNVFACKTARAHPAGQRHPLLRDDLRIHGPFLFGATDKINVVTEDLHTLPPVLSCACAT